MAGDEEAQLRIGGIRFPDYLRPTYANFVNVSHTPWDFRMTFGVLKSPMPGSEVEKAQEVGAIEPEAVADIILPANLMHGVIGALKDNFDRYIAEYGAPGLNPEGPEQRGEQGTWQRLHRSAFPSPSPHGHPAIRPRSKLTTSRTTLPRPRRRPVQKHGQSSCHTRLPRGHPCLRLSR